ncbi:DUF4127 family protein [Paenibacillus spongiae]|uniref:DUF4127 family protein n=1 Tax=Paenibacillus spongiae TaxID=2909671 RepID=A0ABY5S085_9BACL|nr:DUF4127 family protein [Paenibacillus spongiae]UVI27266.1 DUF4127 family protein [Paenibacillus spongiae]
MKLHQIALLPLDSRPCCQWFPQKISEIAGSRLIVPPFELLGKFMKTGSCESIRDWLVSAAGEADGMVVAADQLAFGGLIGSRTNERTLEQALGTLEALRTIKENDPEKPLFVSSTLMRISITGRNAEYVHYKELVQHYSELFDRRHRLNETGVDAELEQVKAQIPAAILDDFLRARERNMVIHQQLIDWAAEGIIDYLTITQEDASPVGLHILEQRKLQQQIYERHAQSKTILYPGADEAAQTLLARMLQTLGMRKVKVFPRFTSESGKLAIPQYEDRPIEETVKAHLWAAGSVIVDSPSEADLILAVNPPLADLTNDGNHTEDVKAFFDSRHMLSDLVENAKYYIEQGRRVAIADVALPNASDMELVRYLLDERLFTRLTGYAGWNTAGNSLGTCISQAVARTLTELRRAGSGESMEDIDGIPAKATAMKAEAAHTSFLLSRLMDEWGYQAQVRGKANNWIASNLPVSPWDLESYYDQVNEFVVERMKELFTATRPMLVDSLTDTAALSVRDVQLTSVRLPWNRTFEVDVKLDVTLG